jgi:SSS family transporter
VLIVYFGVLVVSGVWLARRKQHDTRDYFLGARSVPAWAVALSVLATTQSGATFLGAPEQSYGGDLTYLSTSLGMILAALILARFFIPAFYKLGVSTPYGLLESRFGPGARVMSSWMFMLGRLLASGSRLFIAAIPAALIVFGDIDTRSLILCIVALSVAAVVYTLAGGIRSVIIGDCIQAAVYLGAAAAALVFLLSRIDAPPAELVSVLSTAGDDGANKLKLFDTGIRTVEHGGEVSRSFDWSSPFSLPAVLIAFTMLGLASYGTDHDMVQRMLTCKDAKASARSLIASQLIGVPAVLLFLVIGLLLHVFYLRPDLMGANAPSYALEDSKQVFPQFILRELPAGLGGVMMAGLFAAGLSSLNSALNALSSSFISDCYRPLVKAINARFRPAHETPETHYLRAGRIGVAAWGLILCGFACLCIKWQEASNQTLLNFALGVMALAFAGLLGVFLAALFTRRGSSASAVAAMAVGFLVVLAMRDTIWSLWAPAVGLPQKHGLAWPWHLVIGTCCSLAVCAVAPGRDPTGPRDPP